MPRDRFENRLRDIRRFYEILAELEVRVGGKRTLGTANGGMNWPRRGVYFFFEPGEERTTSGTGPRVVRVGTHALKPGAKSTLWGRLRQHRGTVGGANPGSGNHRGSVFRKHVGTALIQRDEWAEAVARMWGVGSKAPESVRECECPLEQAVSQHIRDMPFLWLEVDDEPGPDSPRGHIERNAIALLSNYHLMRAPIDRPSSDWLGNWAKSEEIRLSGLWNVNHVGSDYGPGFLAVVETFLAKT